MTTPKTRKPRVFAPDDPALVIEPDTENVTDDETPARQSAAPATRGLPTAAEVKHGIRWGAMLLSAMAALTALAAGLAWTRFISQAVARNDWIGWTAAALLAIALLAAAVIIVREIVGLFRLARLGRLRKDVEAVLRTKDIKREKRVVATLRSVFAGRHDAKWGLRRLAEHARDVRDPGDLLHLADRELVAPLDVEARRIVVKSAKRVTVVTAMSPMVWIAMLYVIVENLRMLRALASLYGGRPGFTGALRLAKLVVGHIVATGGIAMTDDLLGQFLGQDMVRRLSRRLGEGVFNGALTARVGTAAIEVTRPLPYLDTEPIRIRDLLPELFRRGGESTKNA